MRAVVALPFLAALLIAPAAAASTVSVEGDVVKAVAAPGEVNFFNAQGTAERVEVTDGSTRSIAAPRLTAGPGCAVDPKDPFTVVCTGSFSAVEFRAGDGNDRFGDSSYLAAAVALRAYGEEGNDTKLIGRNGNDLLDGGPGADTFRGGGGHNVLVGGPGSDLLIGEVGSDLIDSRDGEPDGVICGPGRDVTRADRFDRTPSVVEDYACERGEVAQPGVADISSGRLDRRRRLGIAFECVKSGCFGTLRVTAFRQKTYDEFGRRTIRTIRVRGERAVQFKARGRSRRIRLRVRLGMRGVRAFKQFRYPPDVVLKITIRDELGRKKTTTVDTGI